MPDNPIPESLCSLLLFVATPDEQKAVKTEAEALGLKWDADPKLNGYLRSRGLEDKAWSLGQIGAESVVAIDCSRVDGRVVMGPHGSFGSAAKGPRYLSATGAQGIIQVGIAFGINRKGQDLCDVLVSSSLAPYDNRDVKSSGSPPGYLNDYTNLKLEPARQALVDRCVREIDRTAYDFKVQIGVLLSGAARIHCAAFRDELYKQVPHGDDPIIGGEMEGVGLLTGTSNPDDPVWCVVKGICDFADEKRDEDIKSRSQAARNAAKFVLSGLVNDAKMFD